MKKILIDFNSSSLRFVLDFGFRADQFTLGSHMLPKIPNMDKKGRIFTLNKTGFMCTRLDPITLAFIDSTKNATLPVLEIGASYGIASQKALANGAVVVANDIDIRHLLLLKQQVQLEDRSRLYLNNKIFANKTNFPDNSFSAILLCRIMHFLDPLTIEIGLNKLYKWLAPGGRAYFVILSPFHPRLTWFLPVYEKRWNDGISWPGEIKDVQRSWPVEFAKHIPRYLHVMDELPFKQAVQKIGFNIKYLELFNHEPFNSTLGDNKEYLGVILEKNI